MEPVGGTDCSHAALAVLQGAQGGRAIRTGKMRYYQVGSQVPNHSAKVELLHLWPPNHHSNYVATDS